MKYINKILSLFVIALIATSCDPDAESYTPGELEDGNQGICFVGNYTQTVEVEPGITSFDLTLTRSLTDAAGTVDVIMKRIYLYALPLYHLLLERKQPS